MAPYKAAFCKQNPFPTRGRTQPRQTPDVANPPASLKKTCAEVEERARAQAEPDARAASNDGGGMSSGRDHEEGGSAGWDGEEA